MWGQRSTARRMSRAWFSGLRGVDMIWMRQPSRAWCGHHSIPQIGVRLIRSAPFAVEQCVHSARGVALSQGINGTAALLAHEGQGCARPVFVLELRQGRVVGRMGPEKEPGRFRAGPRAMGVADLRARGALPLPRRRLRARAKAARREAILDPREAGAIRDVVEPHHAQDRAHPGDRTP